MRHGMQRERKTLSDRGKNGGEEDNEKNSRQRRKERPKNGCVRVYKNLNGSLTFPMIDNGEKGAYDDNRSYEYDRTTEEVATIGKRKAESSTRVATSVDVAKIAGVSQATVSRAFNAESKLSPETRRRVLEVARSLGYYPNAIARSLVSRKTNIVGIIQMSGESPFYAYLISELVVAWRQRGYYSMMIRQEEGETGDETVLRALEYHVDGIVVTSIHDSQSVREACQRTGTPIMLLNRYIADISIDSVCCDNFGAGMMVAEYLYRKGHRRIACLMGDSEASTTRERLSGLRSFTQEHGMEMVSIQYGRYTYKSGCDMCKAMLSSCQVPPTAVFCSGDIVAFGAIDTLRYQLGMKIPEDISVIGFDDIPEAAWQAYNLTTVRQPYKELIDSTCQLLIRRMNSDDMEGVMRMLHSCRIVERDSVLGLNASVNA